MAYLTDLAAACRKSGLRVVVIPGWRGRGRPSYTGSFNPRGVLCHHTGGSSNDRGYVEWMAKEGRSDLPAPLCQLALDRQGTVYVCAAGRANHAGDAKATGPMPAGDGNSLYIGIEALNTGSEGWTRKQRRAYGKLAAALCAHYGWPASHVRAHRETSLTGKWDPGKLDMDKLRRHVRRILRRRDRVETVLPVVDLSNVRAQARRRPSEKTVNAGVKRIQRCLNRRTGAELTVDGKYGKATRRAYSRYQESLGYTGRDANGIPGEESLRRLGKFLVRK